MARMGYDRTNGFVYEGRFDPTYPIWPTPMLSQATLVAAPCDFERIPEGFEGNFQAWIFREESFDPVSRVRRGRLFQKHGNSSTDIVFVQPHPAIHGDQKYIDVVGKLTKELAVYMECRDILAVAGRAEGAKLSLGTKSSHTLWQIIQTELTLNSDVLVTLRAESTFAILPILDETRFRPENVITVVTALGRVLDAAYRELPTSVVDQCRNAAVVLTSRWMQDQLDEALPREHDLGAWIAMIEKHFSPKPRVALLSALRLINALHPRGKENERQKHSARVVTDADAAMALHALGFAMREMGVTKI